MMSGMSTQPHRESPRIRDRFRWLLLRVIRRMLVSGRGEVRAFEQALHLQERLLVIVLFLATIVAPSMLLAWFAIRSIEQSQVDVKAQEQAERVATAFGSEVEREFTPFETAVRNRLRAGRSPLESLRDLHPYVLVAMQFDASGQLVAPFHIEEGTASEDVGFLFEGAYANAAYLSRRGEVTEDVLDLYRAAEQRAPGRAAQGRAAFDAARTLTALGRPEEALAAYDAISDTFGNVRDPWGFRLRDLARLKRAELTLSEQPTAGAEAVRALVESLLSERWVVGRGGESAVARRALDLLAGESLAAAGGWVAEARQRVADRSQLLYWTETLLPEADRFVVPRDSLRVNPGDTRWSLGERALWATLWWGNEFYAFGLDWETLRSDLNYDAKNSVRYDDPVVATLLAPNESQPEELLHRKSLDPWLPGWSLVVTAKDDPAREVAQARQAWLNASAIALSVTMMILGVVFTIRIVNRELELASMKTEFAANVSHELRSPITQIRLKGEALMYGLAETPEEAQTYYRAIVRESERLTRLVEDVLDFAAIERGTKKFNLRHGDLAETVRRALDSIRSSEELRDKELDVHLPVDLPRITHDSDAIVRCVINLVSNAAKYSSDSNWIGVRARVVDDGVEISISDRGIGIAPHDLRRIFEPYYRSQDPRARRRKGTGLGLTITQRIMEAHGGRVVAYSRPGRGSTFTLRFPLKASEIGGRRAQRSYASE